MRNLTKELSGSLTVQRANKIEVPEEISDWYAGRGISSKYLKAPYGLGKSRIITPKEGEEND
jgi:hypothetical protein